MNHAQPQAPTTAMNRKQRRRAERNSGKGHHGGPAKSTGEVGELLQRGSLFAGQGDLAGAEQLYRQALDLEPRDATALFRLGVLLAQSGRNAEAIETLETARSLAPKSGPIYNNLAAVYAAMGDNDKAVQNFKTCLKLDPKNAETIKNLGTLYFRQQNFEQAASLLDRGLRLSPDDPKRRHLLGISYSRLNRLEDAIAQLVTALKLDPENAEFHANLGVALAVAARPQDALPHLLKGFARKPEPVPYQIVFFEALMAAPLEDYTPDLHEALVACFDAEVPCLQKLAPITGRHLVQRYFDRARVETTDDSAQGTSVKKMHLDGILGDTLLVRLLQKSINVDLALEPLLVKLRNRLLFTAREQASIPRPAVTFMASLAMQCHNNAFLFSVDAEEEREIDRLAAQISAGLEDHDRPDDALELKLVLFAMYHPLHSLADFEKLIEFPCDTWSDELQPLVQLALLNPREEERLKESIPAIGGISDATSQAVRSQYEENPYPRWMTLPHHQPSSFEDFICESYPWIRGRLSVPEQPRCLIAGCGTGRQPISFALRMPQLETTSIDLSLASLAYAKRMAQSYGTTNLKFIHCDILDVEALGGQFDVIECTGVLHHMRDPEEGLASLLKVLRPGGLLRLGLYSETARKWINEARGRITELGLKPTPSDIRAFRQKILTEEELEGCDLPRFNDFYDLDSFRDLVFHVQEQQFTIPRLKDVLSRHGLDFLGFTTLRKTSTQAFQDKFPQDPEMRDLDNWHSFELDHPETFTSMYAFWCVKSP